MRHLPSRPPAETTQVLLIACDDDVATTVQGLLGRSLDERYHVAVSPSVSHAAEHTLDAIPDVILAEVSEASETELAGAVRARFEEPAMLLLRNGAWREEAPSTTAGDVQGTLNLTGLGCKALERAIANAVAQRTTQLQWRQRAVTDELTGLPTRTVFAERFTAARARSRRTQQPFSIVVMDLNDFKQVNDEHGHEAGDDLLKAVSRRIARILRGTDIVARFGGDEFVLLLEDVQHESDVTSALRRIEDAISTPVRLGEEFYTPSASLGVATYPNDGTELDVLLRHADGAMYRHKRDRKLPGERARVSLGDRQHTSLDGARGWRANGNLLSVESPRIDVGTGLHVATCFELLHDCGPSLRRNVTDTIFSQGDDSLVMDAFGWLMDDVVRQIDALPNEHTLSLPTPIAAVRSKAAVRAYSKLHALRPDLTLEAMLFLNAPLDPPSPDWLLALHRSGVRVYLHGLAYLADWLCDHERELSAHGLVIDERTTRHIGEPTPARAVASAAAGWATSRSLITIARGVQQPAQLECLSRWGIDGAEGPLAALMCANADAS